MKALKNIIAFFIIMAVVLQSYYNNLNIISTTNPTNPLKVSVLINNYNINFLLLLTEEMKKVQQENSSTVQYTFYDGNGDQNTQTDQLNTILDEKNVDLIIVDMVDLNQTKYAVDRIKESNLPVIFFDNGDIESIRSYQKACLVRANPAEGGISQGNIIIDAWNKNKSRIDKNQDDTLQYIMLLGTPNNIFAIERTKYFISILNNSTVTSEEIGNQICNWNEDEANSAINRFLLKFGNKIEAIIANDDGMAIGAVKALQQSGYNLGGNTEKIMVVGCDGIPIAQDLIQKGFMTGTVELSAYDTAKDIYTISINLINNKNLIEGTNCTIDDTGKLVTIPYNGVLVNLD